MSLDLFPIEAPIAMRIAPIAWRENVSRNFFMLALFTCLIKKGIEMHVAERPKFPSTELFIAIRDSEFFSPIPFFNLLSFSFNRDDSASFHIKTNTSIGGE